MYVAGMAQIPGSLWLWRRPVATVSTGPLTWEPPSAAAMALKDKKKKKSVLQMEWGQKALVAWVMEGHCRDPGHPSPEDHALS